MLDIAIVVVDSLRFVTVCAAGAEDGVDLQDVHFDQLGSASHGAGRRLSPVLLLPLLVSSQPDSRVLRCYAHEFTRPVDTVCPRCCLGVSAVPAIAVAQGTGRGAGSVAEEGVPPEAEPEPEA